MKKCFFSLVILSMISLFSSCGSQPELKIANVNVSANTFDFIDVKSGNTLSYQKLMLNDREVMNYHCSNTFAESVTFALNADDIARTGNSVNIKQGQTFTVHAVLKYKLENGVLTIFYDAPAQKEPEQTAGSQPETEKPKQELKFKGGTCVLKSANGTPINGMNTLMVPLDYTLDEGANSNALQILQEQGKIIAPDGTSYSPSQDPFINETAKSYVLIFRVPTEYAINTLKFVYDDQELVLYQ